MLTHHSFIVSCRSLLNFVLVAAPSDVKEMTLESVIFSGGMPRSMAILWNSSSTLVSVIFAVPSATFKLQGLCHLQQQRLFFAVAV